MKWEGEVVAVKDGAWPARIATVTLAGVREYRGVVELSVPRVAISAYPIGRRVVVTATPR